MSGMGTNMSPDGEQGIGNASGAVPAGTIPDNPSQIAQTTSGITLDVLSSQDFIFKASYTLSTQMPAGTVFAIIPNHPMECNYVHAHLAQLFNTWVGDMLIKFRLIGTAFYGGSVRFAIIPPSFTQDQIRQMSLSELTSYANTDMDPKNTVWNHYRLTDQREVAYHYMKPYDENDRQSFGGYGVFFMAAQLVTQSPEIQTIQMMVETTGRYIYDQPRPLSQSFSNKDPLSTVVPVELDIQMIAETSLPTNTVLVLPGTVQSLTYGNVVHNAIGLLERNDTPGRVITDAAKASFFKNHAYHNHMHHPQHRLSDNLIIVPSSFPVLNFDDAVTDDVFTPWIYDSTSGSEVDVPGIGQAWPVWNEAHDTIQFKHSELFRTTKVGNKVYNENLDKNSTLNFTTPNGILSYDRLNYPTPGCDSGVKLAPTVVGESIVMFANNDFGVMGSQTRNINVAMYQYPTNLSISTRSFIYQLVNANGTPILNLRLNPNGVFTTNKASALVKYPADFLKLRFLQELPISDPLPPMTAAMSAVRAELTFNSRTKTTQVLDSDKLALSSY